VLVGAVLGGLGVAFGFVGGGGEGVGFGGLFGVGRFGLGVR